ncbi:hypothetical protein C1J03_23415 (plasmid) [Sulfitobacter sp. SK012]|uniref:cation transporting ATPase C-terminal domain-containing protein n=1 Tax=Sulfitobacter sp. SK012 TaxID=1389005 RepID=UPI000E0B1840|nr:hypothetical protein C1J03_23415 [Sulfitobacter sp. SK012]
MSMNMLVVLEIFHLFYIRNIFGPSINWATLKGTRPVWISVFLVTAAQFAATYLPAAQPVLGTQAVPVLDGMLIITIGVIFFAIIETEKQLRLILTSSNEI